MTNFNANTRNVKPHNFVPMSPQFFVTFLNGSDGLKQVVVKLRMEWQAFLNVSLYQSQISIMYSTQYLIGSALFIMCSLVHVHRCCTVIA